MKTKLKTALFVLIAATLASCGGNSGSTSGLFGSIPEILENYNAERNSIESEAKANHKNVSEKIKSLKDETTKKLETAAEAINGQELPVSVNEEDLKIVAPLKIDYKSVFSNLKAVDFGLTGNVVAAKDLVLDIDKKELKGEDLLGGGKVVVIVTLPVHIEFLDKDGNVVDTRSIGHLTAENNGESASVKADTPVDFDGSIPVGEQYVNAESARLVIDLSKGLTSRTLAK